MKIKKFLLPIIFIVLTLIAYVAATVAFSYTTKPEITSGEFPFCITYEYKGETRTLSGVFKCEFSGSDTVLNEHDRYWNGESIINEIGEFDIPNVIDRNEGMSLALYENMQAGYFMGDPLYKDWYKDCGLDGVEPYVSYYDYVNEISLDEENYDEILESLDFKIIDYTYAEPIENSFSFSGVQYSGDNISIFILITLAFWVLCLIFVRKNKEYQYTSLDRLGVVFNFLISIFALPLITLTCWLSEIFAGEDFIDQLTFNIPPIAIFCIALSIVFRRKEMKKTGFYIQFVGVALFAVVIILDYFS